MCLGCKKGHFYPFSHPRHIFVENHIFKEHKTNMLKNYSIPEGLKIFLSSIKSELQDHRNRNSVKCNIPQDELHALKELMHLQTERKIVIKACDKGAGLIVLNSKDYMKECYIHLNSKHSNGKPYYSEFDDIDLDLAKNRIKNILDKALEE